MRTHFIAISLSNLLVITAMLTFASISDSATLKKSDPQNIANGEAAELRRLSNQESAAIHAVHDDMHKSAEEKHVALVKVLKDYETRKRALRIKYKAARK